MLYVQKPTGQVHHNRYTPFPSAHQSNNHRADPLRWPVRPKRALLELVLCGRPRAHNQQQPRAQGATTARAAGLRRHRGLADAAVPDHPGRGNGAHGHTRSLQVPDNCGYVDAPGHLAGRVPAGSGRVPG